jgi:hypothetical protein
MGDDAISRHSSWRSACIDRYLSFYRHRSFVLMLDENNARSSQLIEQICSIH